MAPGLVSPKGLAGGGARAGESAACPAFWPLAWFWRALPAWLEDERDESSVWAMGSRERHAPEGSLSTMPVIISLGFCAGTLQV